jgi:lysyl endopeptidase
MWWNPNESGWGINVIQHPSENIFVVWFTYEFDGTQTWFTLPDGTWTSSNTYTGTVYATSGPAATTSPFNPSTVRVTAVGTATLSFADANSGTWSYNVYGISGARSIIRQSF